MHFPIWPFQMVRDAPNESDIKSNISGRDLFSKIAKGQNLRIPSLSLSREINPRLIAESRK